MIDFKGNLPYNGTIDDISIVTEYKYLGLLMNSKLSIKSHLKYINKKISFITYKLYGLRLLDNLKLNINLFKVFLMPLYRLAFATYAEANAEVRKSLITHMEVRLKVFCRIPVNTANKVLFELAGDLKYNY